MKGKLDTRINSETWCAECAEKALDAHSFYKQKAEELVLKGLITPTQREILLSISDSFKAIGGNFCALNHLAKDK